MKLNYKKLGDFIQQVKKRNNDNSLTVDNLREIGRASCRERVFLPV